MDNKTNVFVEDVRKMINLQEKEGKMTGCSKELYFLIDKIRDFLADSITYKDPMKCLKCRQNTEGV